MIARLLRPRRSLPSPARIPTGERVYAVGDIHGRLDLLEDLLAMIDRDDAMREPAKTTLVFLGDLIDRGPDSAGVVDRLVALTIQRDHVRCLLGNHEEVFLQVIDGDDKALRFFCRMGGKETILSYGVSASDYMRLDHEDLAAEIRRRVPVSHRDFIAGFEDVIRIGDYVFVHAGVRPGVPLDSQSRSDLRWIRDTFLSHRAPFDGLIVHGHTIVTEVEEQPNRIGIDTGAFATGRLTAIGLQDENRWLLQT